MCIPGEDVVGMYIPGKDVVGVISTGGYSSSCFRRSWKHNKHVTAASCLSRHPIGGDNVMHLYIISLRKPPWTTAGNVYAVP